MVVLGTYIVRFASPLIMYFPNGFTLGVLHPGVEVLWNGRVIITTTFSTGGGTVGRTVDIGLES